MALKRKNLARQAGFTLLELMVVIVILSLIGFKNRGQGGSYSPLQDRRSRTTSVQRRNLAKSEKSR